MPPQPVDPLAGPRFTLTGRVVAMDDAGTVLDPGAVHVDAGRVLAVAPAAQPPPPGFESAPVLATQGTLYPGLIDLHNHLSYDALTLWDVPKKYGDRSKWQNEPEYHQLVTTPMRILSQSHLADPHHGYVEAVVRFVECKCLLGGVTTSQGIGLANASSGVRHFYRGIVRNVEQTGDPALPEARTHIPDVESRDAAAFLARLQMSTCMLLHLSEGTDAAARDHFLALQAQDGSWAIAPSLAGIHCVGLHPPDFDVLGQHGASMVWSPLSNLLLYGQTADVRSARDAGVRIALGPDWSPSGSKNLFGELKVARAVSDQLGGIFTSRELLEMATRNPAGILGWQSRLGSVEPGKYADLIVVNGTGGDPYGHLLDAPETAVHLVVIGGTPRFGMPELMQPFGQGTEAWSVGGQDRRLNLAQETEDVVVGALTLAQAVDRLRDGLQRLPELEQQITHPSHAALQALLSPAPRWTLVLDHEEPPGTAIRPHLPFGPHQMLTGLAHAAHAAAPEPVIPLELDELTVVDDLHFPQRIAGEQNLPQELKERILAHL